MAFKKYNLSDKELAQLAAAAATEQPSERGQKWEMCLMANLAEKRGYSNPRNFVINSGWFAKAARSAASGSGTTNQTKIGWARSIFNEGKRMIPSYIDEHDCFSDLTSAKNNGKGISVSNRSAYIKDVTIVKNRYGSTWTFYGFPGAKDDPFGYTKKGKEEDLYDDSTTPSSGSSQKVEDTSIGKPAKAFDLIVKSIGKVNIYSQTGINCGRDCYNTLLSTEERAKITTYSTLVDAEKIWKTKYQPIVDAIDKLIDVKVISSKDYWYKHCEDIKYMPQLLIKMGKLNAYIDEVDMNIQTVDQALYKISMFVPGGLDINYWMNNYKKIQYLETLLIKGARQLKMNAESAIVMLINKGVINNGGDAQYYWEKNYNKIPKLSDLLLRFAEWDYDTKTRPENVIPKIYQEQTERNVTATQKQVVDNRKIVTNGQAISQYFGFLNLNGLMTKQDYLYWIQHASSTNISYFAQLLYNVCSRVILKNKSIYDDAACDHIDLLNVDRENNGNKIDDAHHILYFNNGLTTVSQEYSKDINAPSEQDNKIGDTTFTHYIPDLAIYGGGAKPTAINISNEIYSNVPLTQFLDVDNDTNIEAFKVPDGVSYRNKLVVIPAIQDEQEQESYYPLQSVKHFTLTAPTAGTYVFCYQITKEDGCAGIELYDNNNDKVTPYHPKKVDKVTGKELEEISNIYYYIFNDLDENVTLDLHLVITSQKNMAYVDKNYGVNWHFDLYNMTWGQTDSTSTSPLPKQYIPGLLGEPVVQFDGDEITYSNELQLPTQPLYGTSVGNVIRPSYNHLLPHSCNGYANLQIEGYIFEDGTYKDVSNTHIINKVNLVNNHFRYNYILLDNYSEFEDFIVSAEQLDDRIYIYQLQYNQQKNIYMWVKYVVKSYERNDNYYQLSYSTSDNGKFIFQGNNLSLTYDFNQWLNNNIDCEIKYGACYNTTGINDSYKPLQFDSKITVIPEGENTYYLNIGGVEKYKLEDGFTIYFRSADITINQNANANVNLAVDKISNNQPEREYWLSDVFYPSLGQIYRRVEKVNDDVTPLEINYWETAVSNVSSKPSLEDLINKDNEYYILYEGIYQLANNLSNYLREPIQVSDKPSEVDFRNPNNKYYATFNGTNLIPASIAIESIEHYDDFPVDNIYQLKHYTDLTNNEIGNPLPLQYIKPNLDKFTISETRGSVIANDPGYFIAISRNHYSVYPHEEHPEVVEEQYDGVSAGSAAGGVDIEYDPDLEPQRGGN